MAENTWVTGVISPWNQCGEISPYLELVGWPACTNPLVNFGMKMPNPWEICLNQESGIMKRSHPFSVYKDVKHKSCGKKVVHNTSILNFVRQCQFVVSIRNEKHSHLPQIVLQNSRGAKNSLELEGSPHHLTAAWMKMNTSQLQWKTATFPMKKRTTSKHKNILPCWYLVHGSIITPT